MTVESAVLLDARRKRKSGCLSGAQAKALGYLLSSAHPGDLAVEHREDLRRSGLRDETIRVHRICSIPPAAISRLLTFDPMDVISALLIPFPDPPGGFMNHVRMKVFPAFKDSRGNTVKYLQPRGSGQRLYFPIPTIEGGLGSTSPLWLVEGEKKALAVAQLGLPAVGFCGIEGWHVARSQELLPDFKHLHLRDRTIELVPDGDWRSNPAVRRGAERLALALHRRGAKPRLVVLPEVL